MSVSLGIASRENFKRKYGRPQSEREHGINLNASTREKVWHFWWKEEVRLFFTIKQRTKGGRVILNLSTTVYLEWDVENPCFFSHKSWWFVLTKGSRSNVNFRNSLRWPIYVINSVDNTELPCYTLPPTQQHHSFFRNQPPSIHYKWSTNLEDKEAGAWFVVRGYDCG